MNKFSQTPNIKTCTEEDSLYRYKHIDKAYLEVFYNKKWRGTLVFELFENEAPISAKKFKDLCTSTEYGTYCEEKFQKIVPRFGIKAGKTDYESVDEIDLYVPELKHRFVSSGNHNNYTSRPTDIAFEQELHNATLLTNGKQSLPPRGSSALESRHQLQPGTGLFVPGYKVVNKSQLATSGMKTPGQNILYSKRSRPTSSDSSRTDRSITSNSTGKMSTFSDSDSITSISTESSSSSLSSLAPLPVPKLKNQSKPYGYQNEITDTFPNYHMSVRPYTPPSYIHSNSTKLSQGRDNYSRIHPMQTSHVSRSHSADTAVKHTSRTTHRTTGMRAISAYTPAKSAPASLSVSKSYVGDESEPKSKIKSMVSERLLSHFPSNSFLKPVYELSAFENSQVYPLNRRGLLLWCDNGNEFLITFRPLPFLNGRYKVIGQLLKGFSILDKMENYNATSGKAFYVGECGLWKGNNVT